MLDFSCTFRFPLGHVRTDNFIRPFEVEIRAVDEADDEKMIPVGRIAGDVLEWSEAARLGHSLFEICDEDSDGWYQIWKALSDPDEDGKVNPELDIDDILQQVVFPWRIVLHPCLQPWRLHILEAVMQQWSYLAVIALLPIHPSLTAEDYVELGFSPVDGSDVLIRPIYVYSPLTQKFPRGIDDDLVEVLARPEFGEWLETEWAKEMEGPDLPHHDPPPAAA